MPQICIENGFEYRVRIGDERSRRFVGVVGENKVSLVAKRGRPAGRTRLIFFGRVVEDVIHGRGLDGKPNGVNIRIARIG